MTEKTCCNRVPDAGQSRESGRPAGRPCHHLFPEHKGTSDRGGAGQLSLLWRAPRGPAASAPGLPGHPGPEPQIERRENTTRACQTVDRQQAEWRGTRSQRSTTLPAPLGCPGPPGLQRRGRAGARQTPGHASARESGASEIACGPSG